MFSLHSEPDLGQQQLTLQIYVPQTVVYVACYGEQHASVNLTHKFIDFPLQRYVSMDYTRSYLEIKLKATETQTTRKIVDLWLESPFSVVKMLLGVDLDGTYGYTDHAKRLIEMIYDPIIDSPGALDTWKPENQVLINGTQYDEVEYGFRRETHGQYIQWVAGKHLLLLSKGVLEASKLSRETIEALRKLSYVLRASGVLMNVEYASGSITDDKPEFTSVTFIIPAVNALDSKHGLQHEHKLILTPLTGKMECGYILDEERWMEYEKRRASDWLKEISDNNRYDQADTVYEEEFKIGG